MRIIKDIAQMRTYIAPLKKQSRSIAFVPTMGALHQGHMALVATAARDAAEVVVSIFVNPTQFGPGEDFEKYPKTLERDLELLRERGVGAVFCPQADELYGDGFSTKVLAGRSSLHSCGGSRPGHFDGVTTIVAKLLNIVTPDLLVMGKKDYQQLVVIRDMIADLNLPVELVGVATEREDSGLALSSRNQYLTTEQKEKASLIYKALSHVREVWQGGEDHITVLKEVFQTSLSDLAQAEIEYIDFRNLHDFKVVTERLQHPGILLVAVRYEGVRLIDNIELES